MICMRGRGVSGGAAQGRLYFLRREATHIIREAREPLDAGLSRLGQALEQARADAETLAGDCRRQGRNEAAQLLETHALMLQDEDYCAAIRQELEAGSSAEYAVQAAGERFAAQLAGMEDEYMQARADDVRDVTRRLLDALTGCAAKKMPTEPFILAAAELAPSECIRLERRLLLGIALRGGSGEGHTAILARTMGIPAVFGLGELLREDMTGKPALIDGDEGVLLLEPDAEAASALAEKQARRAARDARLEALRGLEDVSPDGRRLEILCSIAAPEDCGQVLANDGRGVGLFRSELLFLAGDAPPDEERQYHAYRDVVQAMAGRRVVIRTADLGADKQAPWLDMAPEANPALGERGVRLGLRNPDMLRTQLRAILRASAHGRVAVLLPMITSVREVQDCRRLCREAMAELSARGLPFDGMVEVGVMIETPAAVLIADELAKAADFFSIGTGDLTQYILACDRQAAHLHRYSNPRHPAVLRALRMTAEAAARAGRRVCVCGELGADADMLPFFLEIGVHEVAVPPPAVLPLRAALRGIDVGEGGSCPGRNNGI